MGVTMLATILICTILYCHDGDTCKCVDAKKKEYTIRLANIDSPELKYRKCNPQPYAIEAAHFINEKIKGKSVKIELGKNDIYGRTLGTIYLGKEDINGLMVQNGFAEVYRDHRFESNQYYKFELGAKQKKLNIWSLKDYTSPMYQREKCK